MNLLPGTGLTADQKELPGVLRAAIDDKQRFAVDGLAIAVRHLRK
jgi:hypothetical protein